jgi:tetratricopeptide (TPR) repeat protein
MSSAVVQAMVAGNAAVSRGTPADLAEARTAFEQAIKLDERYAPAHAGLTLALVRIADAGVERPGAILPRAIEHGDLAVELDPASALGWYALARAEVLWTRDWSRAETHYRRAIGLDPESPAPVYYLAELLAALGRTSEAREVQAKAVVMDGLTPRERLSDAKVQYLIADYEAARDRLAQALLEGVAEAAVTPWLVRSQVALGAMDAAVAAAQKADAASGRSSWPLGYALARTGRRTDAERVLAAMGEVAKKTYVPALDFACVWAGLDNREQALTFIETAVREHSPGSELLPVDPIFADLRSEPRFRAALAEAKLGTGR